MSSWIPANVVRLMGRNSGKAVSLDTPVYYRTTDRGEKIEKKTIGDLKVGDVIYNESGNLTEENDPLKKYRKAGVRIGKSEVRVPTLKEQEILRQAEKINKKQKKLGK